MRGNHAVKAALSGWELPGELSKEVRCIHVKILDDQSAQERGHFELAVMHVQATAQFSPGDRTGPNFTGPAGREPPDD